MPIYAGTIDTPAAKHGVHASKKAELIVVQRRAGIDSPRKTAVELNRDLKDKKDEQRAKSQFSIIVNPFEDLSRR